MHTNERTNSKGDVHTNERTNEQTNEQTNEHIFLDKEHRTAALFMSIRVNNWKQFLLLSLVVILFTPPLSASNPGMDRSRMTLKPIRHCSTTNVDWMRSG